MTLLKAYLKNKRDPFTLAKAFLDVLKDEQAVREERMDDLGAKYFSEAIHWYEDELIESGTNISEHNTHIQEIRTILKKGTILRTKSEKGIDGEMSDVKYEDNITDKERGIYNQEIVMYQKYIKEINQSTNKDKQHLKQLKVHYKELMDEDYDDRDVVALIKKGIEILIKRKKVLEKTEPSTTERELDELIADRRERWQRINASLMAEGREKDWAELFLEQKQRYAKDDYEKSITSLENTKKFKDVKENQAKSQINLINERLGKARTKLREMEVDISDLKDMPVESTTTEQMQEALRGQVTQVAESDILSDKEYAALTKPEQEEYDEKFTTKLQDEYTSKTDTKRRKEIKERRLKAMAKRAIKWEKDEKMPGPEFRAGTGKNVLLDFPRGKTIKPGKGKYKGVTYNEEKDTIKLDKKMTKLINDSNMPVRYFIHELNRLNPHLALRGKPEVDKPVMYTEEEIDAARIKDKEGGGDQAVYMERMNKIGRGKGRQPKQLEVGNLKEWKEWKEEFARTVRRQAPKIRDELNKFFDELDPKVLNMFNVGADPNKNSPFGMVKHPDEEGGEWGSLQTNRHRTLKRLGKIFSRAIKEGGLKSIQEISAKTIISAINEHLESMSGQHGVKEQPKISSIDSKMLETMTDFIDETEILLEIDTQDRFKEIPKERLEELTEDVSKLLQDIDEENPTEEDYIQLLIRFNLIELTIKELGPELPRRAENAKESLKEYLNSLEAKFKEKFGVEANDDLQRLQNLALKRVSNIKTRRPLGEKEYKGKGEGWKPPKGYYTDETVRRSERIKLHKEELLLHIATFERLVDTKGGTMPEPTKSPDQTDEEYADVKRRFMNIEDKTISPKTPLNKDNRKRIAEMTIPQFKVDMTKVEQERKYDDVITQQLVGFKRGALIKELASNKDIDIKDWDILYDPRVDIMAPKSYTEKYKQKKQLTAKEMEALGSEDIKEEWRKDRLKESSDEEFTPEDEESDEDEFNEANVLINQATNMAIDLGKDWRKQSSPLIMGQMYNNALAAAKKDSEDAANEGKPKELPKEFQKKNGEEATFDDFLDNVETERLEEIERRRAKKEEDKRYDEDIEVLQLPRKPKWKPPEKRIIDAERAGYKNLLDPNILQDWEEEE